MYYYTGKITTNQPYNLINNYINKDLMSYLTVNDILNIFVHNNKSKINIPDKECKLFKIEDNKVILYLKKYNRNLLDFEFMNEMKCLINVPVFLD